MNAFKKTLSSHIGGNSLVRSPQGEQRVCRGHGRVCLSVEITDSLSPIAPLVCLDETSKQLIAETRVRIPTKPGQMPGPV